MSLANLMSPPLNELETTRQRLLLAIDASNLGTFYCPMPLGIIELNTKCKEHFWLPPDAEVDFDLFYARLHAADREHVRVAVDRAVFGKEDYDVEYRTVSPDRQIRWIRAIGRGFYDAEGNPTRFDGVTIDITASKNLEDELREQRRQHELVSARLRFLNEISEETRNLARPEDVMRAVNSKLGSLMGVSRCAYAPMHEDGDGFTILDNFTAGCRSVLGDYKLLAFGERIFRDLHEGKVIVVRDVDAELTPEDGADTFNSIEIKAVICCPLIKAGRLVALMAVHQTVPRSWTRDEIALVEEVAERSWTYIERVHSSLALSESEQRFRSLVSATTLIVWRANARGDFNENIPGWQAFTGQRADEYRGRGWLDSVHSEDRSMALDAWHRALSAHSNMQTIFRIRRRDGEYRRTLVTGVPVMDASGAVVEWIGTCTDVEDKLNLDDQREALLEAERAARSEAERASRMKDEFLATLSHELRTPLSAILGWSQILAAGSGLSPEVAQAAEVIARNARLQSQIIDDLLDMNRIISGKIHLDVQVVDLARIIESSLETVRPAAVAKGIRLRAVLDERAGPVSGDPSRLQQIFWNLLTNAIKFTPRGGNVRIVLSRIDSHIDVSVIDNGIGIAEEFLPHVFDRFTQADSSSTRHHGGLGLGLAIVRQLSECHGGWVRAASEGAGRGCTFTVSLPLLPIHALPSEAQRHPNSSIAAPVIPESLPRLDGVTVLVVDDEPDARDVAKRLLTSQGAEVTTAASADEAFELLKNSPPTVLVSDIGMPGEDGLSLIRRVRKLDSSSAGATPALALTAYARSEDRMAALLAGFQMHTAKPVEAPELLAMVASLAGRTRGEA